MKLSSRKGFTTLIFLSLLLMLSLLGINAIMTSSTDVNIAGYEMNSMNSMYAAEAGLEQLSAEIKTYYKENGKPPTVLPQDSIQVGQFGVKFISKKPGVTSAKTYASGAFKGLYSLSDEYIILARASNEGLKATKTLQATIEAGVIPLYQFAIFYEDDLEINPGPFMQIDGRVHCNKDLYLMSGNGLKIDSYTTAGGEMFWGRHPQAGQPTTNGSVEIKDASGVYKNMKNSDGTFLDADDPDWVNKSIARWGGKVEDKNHGATELDLPVVGAGDPIDMIQPSGGNPDSYENKAGLKIVNGQALWRQPDSTWLNVTADFTSNGIMTNTTFYDGRETKTVSSTDIDISKLNTSTYWPANGVVYASNSGGSLNATRLVNGSQLHGPLTVASENPVYTKGDYNSVNKKSASIMSDALTVLSNNWDDANSTKTLGNRIASDTKVNFAFVTGNVPSGTGGTSYSGGVHNLPRYLENWTNKKYTWSGACVQMWQSEQATGKWKDVGVYYTPPDRYWSFDTNFQDPTKLPPGTPMVVVVVKTSWRELTGEDADLAMSE